MLTNPLAKTLYSKFANSEIGFTTNNIGLAAKCAMMIYRKCGKIEAEMFITEIRVIMLVDNLKSRAE